jgi:hypothetical protein
MKVFHQAGHNTSWNLESFQSESCADGIIFSPVHYSKERMVKLLPEVRKASLFDPQFYIPDSQKSKLHSYEFFPEKITNGFSTTDFEAVAHQSAAMCLDFQIENDFESIIVPARYFPELVSDYVAKQKAFTVEPFLAELQKRKTDKKVFLSLPVTTAMTQDKGYRNELLNWITSYPEIQGVYLLNEFRENTKQLGNFEKLQAHVDFIRDLQGANLKVIIGYCNTESIIMSLLDPHAVAVGAYENTRGFSIDKFLEEESDKRGPAPRLYFPKLLNWMRYDTAVELKEDHPEVWKEIYIPTLHSDAIFDTGRPHFTKPELYKHHFLLICDQLRDLGSKQIAARTAAVKDMITQANSLYRRVEETGVMYFDRNCSGDHLPVWNRVVSKMSAQK